ncbi:hypothetical protein [Flaviaesturariibacter amylovorans]|uniref:Uncharacterized protein n=1 Tax=Flaviaesturariibacter amylovorans TaxID=1084520 RepID=A0ABP8H7Q6_9BACT
MYLKMYVSGLLVAVVPLNYNGLHTPEERVHYLQGTMRVLCEEHEPLLQRPGARPEFLLDRTGETVLIGGHSFRANSYLN